MPFVCVQFLFLGVRGDFAWLAYLRTLAGWCCGSAQAAQLRPEWSKAHYRLARARRLEGAAEEYVANLWEAFRLDPTNTQIR